MTPTPSARLLDALVEIIATRGMEAVSVRSVASAAGVSIGAVQHHFPTKDAMLLAAMDRVAEHFQHRLDERATLDAPAEQVLRAVVEALAALQPDDRPGTVVWLAFVARACVDEAVAGRHRDSWTAVERLLADCLAAHRHTSAEAEAAGAAELLALADGLAVATATEPARMPPERARLIVDAALERALARRGRRF